MVFVLLSASIFVLWAMDVRLTINAPQALYQQDSIAAAPRKPDAPAQILNTGLVP